MLMGIQHIHKAMGDEVKGFPLLLLPPSIENTMFHGIKIKERKRDFIQISKMVEDEEMVKVEYLKNDPPM